MTTYILVDFENVQPNNLEICAGGDYKVIVFLGANQSKIPAETAMAMQSLGSRARYIKIPGNGKNALDFHIAYYVGELKAKQPKSRFIIVSRDTGFDALIRHLKSRDIAIVRKQQLSSSNALDEASVHNIDENAALAMTKLRSLGKSKPRKVKTLANTINNSFAKKLSDEALGIIVKDLEKRKYIKISGNNVSYNSPI